MDTQEVNASACCHMCHTTICILYTSQTLIVVAAEPSQVGPHHPFPKILDPPRLPDGHIALKMSFSRWLPGM